MNCASCKFWLPNSHHQNAGGDAIWGDCDIKLPRHMVQIMDLHPGVSTLTRCDEGCDLGRPEEQTK